MIELPHNLEAEAAVLGSIIIDSTWESYYQALPLLSACKDPWYKRSHRLIWEAICGMAGDDPPVSVDLVTLEDRLASSGHVLDGGQVYLAELAESVPTAANVAHYAGIVRDRAIRREMVALSREMGKVALNQGLPIEETISEWAGLSEELLSTTSASDDVSRLDSLFRREANNLDEAPVEGFRVGIPEIESFMPWWMLGDIVIFAGRPSMGKSRLARWVAIKAAMNGHHSVTFSMEEKASQVMGKALACASGVSARRIRYKDLGDYHKEAIYSGVQSCKWASGFYLCDDRGIRPSGIKAKVRSLKKRDPAIKLVVVDYLQLMAPDGRHGNRNLEISAITRQFKCMAGELDVTILLLSQLSRGVEHRENKRPRLSDLRDSGAIEQDADAVCMIYRDEYYRGADCPEAVRGITELIVPKMRDGQAGGEPSLLAVEPKTQTLCSVSEGDRIRYWEAIKELRGRDKRRERTQAKRAW